MQVTHHPGRRLPWRLDLRSIGGGRRFFATEREALAAGNRAEKDRQEVGREWVDLPTRDRAEVVRVLREMESAGVTLAGLWQAYQRREIDMAKPPTSPGLAVAIAQLVAAKRASQLRPAYIASLETYLGAFARGRESKPVGSFTPDDIRQWFDARKEKPGTMASNIGRLSSLFAYAVRRGWLPGNPVDGVERPRLEGRTPQILTVRQAARLLVFIRRRHPRGLAWFVLALLAGIRPEECDRLTWVAVDLREGIVTIDAAASKVRRRRIVHLQPAAAAWLKIARQEGGELPLAHVTRRRYLRAARERLGWTAWPQDILRHTCASYLLALWQDAGRVASELGNSAGILLRHYRELVRRVDAERFWALIPRDRFPRG